MPKCPKDCKKKNCIFFRTINIPAIVANDEETPPKNGEYCNALVVYESTGNAYLFPSDGIPTLLSTANYALLKNLPSINGVTVVGDLTLSDIGVTQLVEEEADARAASDVNLQEQIDAIVASSDVVDIVGTYEELEEYDTSRLTVNDVIKVISDETEGGATTYYRWTGSAWDYIGAEGPYYTTAQIDSMLDEKLDVGALNDYYNKAEVDALLVDKADSSDLADKQDKLVAGANISIDQATNVISATMPSLANYYTKQETYSQNEVDSLVSGVEAQIPTNTSDLNNDSGFLTSIPTASSSVLGGVKVGSGLSIDQNGVLSATGTSITIDSALSTTSTNPVENRVITNALSNKADVSAIPVVPTNVSSFYNDAGYVTSSTIASNYYNKTETYTQNEVDGLISGVSASIPTKTSDLTNNSGFITSASLPTKTSDLVNDGADNTSTYVEADELAAVATSGSYNDLSDKPTIMTGLVEMSYGESNAWAKFIAAYQAKQIVYCRASSNSNPASGSQTRKAFMAYVNNAETPTEVEFQYVRSVSSKTSSQPVDQVFVYKLTSSNGGTWTVQTRDMAPKLAAGTNTSVSYSSGTYTVNATQPTKTSDLTNDGADGTSTYVEADELNPVATDGIVMLKYGVSTWSDFITAFNGNRVIYCTASSNADPTVGNQSRLAALANVDDVTAPTHAEFRFLRAPTLSNAQQTAQVFIYRLENDDSWTVTTRETGTKVVAGTNMTSSYSNGAITLDACLPTNVTSSVSPATNVSLNSGFRVLRVGNIIIINGEITVSAQIADYQPVLSDLPIRNPASSFYFTAQSTSANSVRRVYIDAAGVLRCRVLPADSYAINVVYTTS